MILGAGRETKEDLLDLSAGIILNKKVGDYVKEGETIATIYYNKEDKLENSIKMILDAYFIEENKIDSKKLIYGVVTKDYIKKY